MDPRDRRQLDFALEALGSIGDRVVGAYFFGSGALADLRPHSDLDIFVLLSGSTRHPERRHLVERFLEVSGRAGSVPGGRPLEVTIARLEDLHPWPTEPRREFQYGEWLRSEYLRGMVPRPETDDDLAALVATVLTASHALLGPPAASLLDPVPRSALEDAMVRTVPSLLSELDDDTHNVLLTLARIVYTLTHGSIVTKDSAAAWALSSLSEAAREPLARARRWYLGEPHPPPGSRADPHRTADELVAQLG